MKLLALDGNSILNRAFYGIRLLTTKEGVYTNGIFGFLNILNKLREMVEPDAVAATFDLRAPTFRHKEYEQYKAGRKGMPDELASQLPLLKELLQTMGIRVLECEGYEADDILGTLARAAGEQGVECFIATGDRDSLQLIAPGVQVLLAATKAGQPVVTQYDESKIMEEYGVTPRQLIDIKALQGDASDHIPGVAGVGQKTALDLIQRFGSVQAIYAQIEGLDIRDTLRQKLLAGRDDAFMSYRLGTIVTDVPIDNALQGYLPGEIDKSKLAGLLRRLEFYKLLEKWGLTEEPEAQQGEEASQQISALLCVPAKDTALLISKLREEGKADVAAAYSENGQLSALCFHTGDQLWYLTAVTTGFEEFCHSVFAQLPVRTHDVKPLHTALHALGIEIGTVAFDTLLAGYLLNPSASGYGIDRLAQEYVVQRPQIEGELEQEVQALAAEASVLPELCAVLEQKTAAIGQQKLLHDIEIPLARVLASMEQAGFLVDKEGLEHFGKVLDKRIREISQDIYEMVGYEFNLNSPKQLGEALFVKLGLPCKKKTKTGYSTNAEVLEELKYAHPAVEQLLEYRQLSKLKSTYCDGMAKAVGADGRIHSTLNQTETRTGRISSAEPNLQNIPVRRELGRELRRFFTAKPGCVLCDADYSQIELRVLAHIAGDQKMIEAFRSGTDIHTRTASEVFGMPPEMVTPLMRTRAKAVNFGIVYGIGAFSLAQDLGISFGEAKDYIKRYMDTYPGVRDYMERTVKEAKEKGYAETLFGRRRYLPELSSSNASLRAFGERVARNMPIQGTAADIIKIAMVNVYRRLKRENMRSRLILQVHDELIVEAPENEREAALKVLKEEMEHALTMLAPLIVDVHAGQTWYDAKE